MTCCLVHVYNLNEEHDIEGYESICRGGGVWGVCEACCKASIYLGLKHNPLSGCQRRSESEEKCQAVSERRIVECWEVTGRRFELCMGCHFSFCGPLHSCPVELVRSDITLPWESTFSTWLRRSSGSLPLNTGYFWQSTCIKWWGSLQLGLLSFSWSSKSCQVHTAEKWGWGKWIGNSPLTELILHLCLSK